MKYINADGDKLNLIATPSQYTNGNLYIELTNAEDGELYADLTVNLGIPLPPNQAYVNDNDFRGAELFIIRNKLGHPLGITGRSGYHDYPLYEFNL